MSERVINISHEPPAFNFGEAMSLVLPVVCFLLATVVVLWALRTTRE